MEDAKDQINQAYRAIAAYPHDNQVRARAKRFAKRALQAYIAQDSRAVHSALAQLHVNLSDINHCQD